MRREVVVTCHALFISLAQHTFRSFLFDCAALVWQHEKQVRLPVVLKQQVHFVYPASHARDTDFLRVEDTVLHCGGTRYVGPRHTSTDGLQTGVIEKKNTHTT